MKAKWQASVERKLGESGLRLPPPALEEPEALARGITSLEDPFPLLRLLTVGEAALITSFSPDYREGRLFAKAYCFEKGHDLRLFEKALSNATGRSSRYNPYFGDTVSSYFSILSNTRSDGTGRLLPIISANADGKLSPGRLRSYGMRWLAVKDEKPSGYPEEVLNRAGGDQERLELYMDAQLGFVITFKGIENALCSFWPENADTLLIHQMQGVRKKKFKGGFCVGRHHSRGLNGLDFRKAMVEFVADVGREAGFSSIGILGGCNNPWLRTDDDGHPHITVTRASEIYDGTAVRMGFRLSHNGNWYLPLSS